MKHPSESKLNGKDKAVHTTRLPMPECQRTGPLTGSVNSFKFLRGPISTEWLFRAGQLKGRALALGVFLWVISGCIGKRTFALKTSKVRPEMSRKTVYSSLKSLEAAALIKVERRAGAHPTVTLISDTPARH